MMLLGQETENKFRHYQQDITHHIQKLRSAMIGAFGTDVSTNQNVIEAKGALERACVGSSHMGYMIRVDEHFVDRVEKSLQAGQVPEKQMEASKTDNSVKRPRSRTNCRCIVWTKDAIYREKREGTRRGRWRSAVRWRNTGASVGETARLEHHGETWAWTELFYANSEYTAV